MKCEIDDSRMFLHVIRERKDPLAVVRESISNSYDAGARRIKLVVTPRGREYVDFEINDDGMGIRRRDFRFFFGLGFRNKRSPLYIGNKGLGTKTYFNSDKIVVKSRSPEGEVLMATLDNPIAKLESGHVPDFRIQRLDAKEITGGTCISILRFRASSQSPSLSGDRLLNYIKWQTAVGSCAKIIGHRNKVIPSLTLVRRGVGEKRYEIQGGHELPGSNRESMDDYDCFTKTFERFTVALGNDSGQHLGILEVVGSIVGPKGHIMSDRRIKKRYKGVFLAKDCIIVRSVNDELFGGTGEWQNMHIIANCQQLNLTMSRDDFTDRGPSGVYAEVIACLREFVNAIKRGNRFRYRGRTIEIGNNYAGAAYSKLKALRHDRGSEELKRLQDIDLIALTSVARTELSDDGGPVFEPINDFGVLLIFQALVSRQRTFRSIGHDSDGIQFKVLGYASDCLVLQRNVDGKWSDPLFYKAFRSFTALRAESIEGINGLILWSGGNVDSLPNGIELIILRDQLRTY